MTTRNVNTSQITERFFSEPGTPDSSSTIHAGDMVYRDATAYTLKPVTSDANAQYFKGVSLDQYPMDVYGSTLTEQQTQIAVQGIGEFEMKTTAGEVYHPGELVYVGADAQTVTKVAGTYAVGSVSDYAATVAGLTGAAGVKVKVNIRRRQPSDVALS